MKQLKILMVGPGIMPIPSPGWGAVETVIWQLKIFLEKQGHKVDILNKRGLIAALLFKPWRYDFVHLHYDELAGFWNTLSEIFGFKLFITTHYGYAAFPHKWEEDYYENIFSKLKKSRNLIVLSNEIMNVFLSKGFQNNIKVVTNGTDTDSIKFRRSSGNGRAICLGKIEPRKRQSLLSEIMTKNKMICDFVGPLFDKNFTFDQEYSVYKGKWTRDDIRNKLTEYSTLILFSDGEAHPLVVLEAFAAGLSVVVSPQASANIDTTKPWIFVVEDIEKLPSIVNKACTENHLFRGEIRDYAEKYFNWDVIIVKYLEATRA